MSKHLTPNDVVKRLIGKPEAVASIIGSNAKSPYGWRHPSGWRAAGDIPPIAQRKLLIFSNGLGLGLKAEHLILGADEAEIEAILAARPQRSAA